MTLNDSVEKQEAVTLVEKNSGLIIAEREAGRGDYRNRCIRRTARFRVVRCEKRRWGEGLHAWNQLWHFRCDGHVTRKSDPRSSAYGSGISFRFSGTDSSWVLSVYLKFCDH